ncbi:hypothetical protein ON064_15900 [Planococcus sp. A6]|uniref:hypothetical protein n=1 Tax=Planococcus sp. A6 TaxID=2992760 RepID=UPI00237BBC96|nr:hypothetical protein [Planococcus sp. A6]MDE0584508.1 hypothetical protein [Planococcus sp. A6]
MDDNMPKAAHYAIIIVAVVLLIVLYNRALGSIPFLILSAYFFYFGWDQLMRRKKKSR